MSDERPSRDEKKAVPPTLKLAWMLFMRPLELHETLAAWGIHDARKLRHDPPLWHIGRRLLDDDPTVRTLVGRLALILVILGPLASLAIGVLLHLTVGVDWRILLTNVAFSVILGLGVAVVGAMIMGVALGVTYGLLGAVSFDLALGFAFGLALGVTFAVAYGNDFNAKYGPGFGIALGVVGGLFMVFQGSGIGFGLAFAAGLLRLPIYAVESLVTIALALRAKDPRRAPQVARWLPHRHHQLVYFPLPGLSNVLISIGRVDPERARDLIDQASLSLAQGGPARRAHVELQGHQLEQATEQQSWREISNLEGEFFPDPRDLEPSDPLHTFRAVADLVHRSRLGGTATGRADLLEMAHGRIHSLSLALIGKPGHRHQRLHRVALRWKQAIEQERTTVRTELTNDPKPVNTFRTERPLDPSLPREAKLLRRTRRDLLEALVIDIHHGSPEPLLLTGQPGMGRTSVLNMLHLEVGPSVVVVHPKGFDRDVSPRTSIVEAIAKARLPGLPQLEPGAGEDVELRWLIVCNAALEAQERRIVVAFDDLDRTENALGAEPTNALHRWIRMLPDAFERIRPLLVYPIPHPAAALLPSSPRHRHVVGPLSIEDAEHVLRGREDHARVIEPRAAAEILKETGAHPLLVQRAGSELIELLRRKDDPIATPRDVESAIDRTFVAAKPLFSRLWNDLTPSDTELLRTLADGEPIDPTTATFRRLCEQSFVQLDPKGNPAFTVPLFRRWISDLPS